MLTASRINSEATARVTPTETFTETDLVENTPETNLDLEFTISGL